MINITKKFSQYNTGLLDFWNNLSISDAIPLMLAYAFAM